MEKLVVHHVSGLRGMVGWTDASPARFTKCDMLYFYYFFNSRGLDSRNDLSVKFTIHLSSSLRY